MVGRKPTVGWVLSAVWAVGLGAPGLARGQETQALGPIRWRAADLAPTPDGADAAQFLAPGAARHVVVRLRDVPSTGVRTELAAKGLQLLRYLGDNSYFAKVDARGAQQAVAPGGVTSTFDIRAEWKQDPKLLRGEIPAHARFKGRGPGAQLAAKPGGPQAEIDAVALYVIFHPDVNTATDGTTAVQRHGGLVRRPIQSINGAVVWLPQSNVAALAAEDVVEWVEPPLPPLGAVNDSNRAITQADVVQASPYSLDGTGINVLVYDAGYAYSSHADFGGRLTVRDSSGLSDHATHVSGTIGGDGSASGGVYRGMAPGVIIQSYGFEVAGGLQPGFLYTDPGDLEQDYNEAINVYGAEIANNSIGTNVAPNGYDCAWEGDYGATSMLIDAVVRGSLGAPMRIIWANGNERGSGRCGTTYHTTAPPACAKNHITVGALNSNNDGMTNFSSWGPTDDGRLKPDISAPGCQSNGDFGVTSCISDGGYDSYCGTSMASPTVCGLSALILQDYKAQYGLPLPRNSTLKVLFAHNAVDLGNPGPDYKFGYGSVRVQATIDFLRNGSFLEDQLDHGEDKLFFVYVTPGTGSLKATLAWDDPPGAINTTPELVNDLDLEAISPGGAATHFPWTLNPANGDTPAVRTQPDHLNNIEQVVVDSPATGLWTIRVRGFSVPAGPQPFSLATSPDVQNCSDAGVITLNAIKYACESSATVRVIDCGLNTDSDVTETLTVDVASDTEPAGESMLLTETSPSSAAFIGAITLSEADAGDVLQVSAGDTVTAIYNDADDGTGQPATVQDNAPVDCAGPVIYAVTVTGITVVRATVRFSTDELARGTVRYGPACGSLTGSASGLGFQTSHNIVLDGLTPNTVHYLAVDAEDEAGNLATDDNSGNCYTFVTPERQDYHTEQFTDNADVDGYVLTLSPNGSLHYYEACFEPIALLPTDPAGGTTLPLTDDDYAVINAPVALYGLGYGALYVGSNGYITFGGGDTNYQESIGAHFQMPRISASFDDYDPTAGGTVSWKQLADRLAVTWQNLPQWFDTDSNTFQVEMYLDGRIQIAWLGMGSTDGVVGISQGNGTPLDFVPTDLSASGPCGPPDPAANPTPADGAQGVSLSATLSWTAGSGATSHDVYFGESPGALVLQINQPGTTFQPAAVEYLKTYYWRIDEVNSTATTPGPLWSFRVRSVLADFDGDEDVDLTDFGHLQACYTGPGQLVTNPACDDATLDQDVDVDQSDYAIFAGCIRGSNVPVDPHCMD